MKNKLIHSHRQGLGTCGKPADPPEDGDDKTTSAMVVYIFEAGKEFQADLLFLKHACSIFRQSSNLLLMDRVRLSNLGLYFFTPKVPSDANLLSNLQTDLA